MPCSKGFSFQTGFVPKCFVQTPNRGLPEVAVRQLRSKSHDESS